LAESGDDGFLFFHGTPILTQFARRGYILFMAGLKVGTCSWKYPSWQGLVYSRPAGIDYLAEYARRFSTVEVDQWFWAPPEPATAAGYAAVTPEDFRFTVKLWNELSLTHFHRKKGETALRPNPRFLSAELFREVVARLQPLQGKIAVLMLQFEYLNSQKIASQAEFLGRLAVFVDAIPRTIPLAIEPRNPAWLNERYFRFLAEHDLGHVFLQGYFMAPVWDIWARSAPLLKGTTVVRLHGPDREGIEKSTGESWDRVVAPKDEELGRIVAMVNDMRGRGLTVYLNVNNHYEGSAPLTIERLRERGLVDGA
jgi:uncharacterized protein YecE (DUF72 family)